MHSTPIWPFNLFLLFYLFVFLLPISASALGASPGLLEFSNILRGETASSVIHLSRGDTSQAQLYRVSFGGTGVDFVTTTVPTIFFAKGESKKDVPIVIDASSIPPGSYTASLVVAEQDRSSSPKTDQQLLSGIAAEIRFSVTQKEIVSYKMFVQSFVAARSGEPLAFDLLVANTGNIPLHLGSAEVVIIPEDRAKKSQKIKEKVDIQETIVPFTERFVRFTMKSAARTGVQRASIAIFSDKGKKLYEEKRSFFVEPSTKEEEAELYRFFSTTTAQSSAAGMSALSWSATVLATALLLGGCFLIRKSRKSLK